VCPAAKGDEKIMAGNPPGAAAAYARKKESNRQNNLRYADLGVDFVDIDAAFIEPTTEIGSGTQIGFGVRICGRTVIGKNCLVGDGCRIDESLLEDGVKVDQYASVSKAQIRTGASISQSVVMESEIGASSSIGPFAYIRPGCRIGTGARIGDFVELKNSTVGDHAKVSHLTYVGDADIGAEVNLGCGVVFVNYNGAEKFRSRVGDGAFIGCNVNLISPVEVDSGAYVAAGTTVTRNVSAGSLSVGRAKERIIEGWVAKRGLLKRKE
jgi:bifunctional UDP-N-acetylglucosamine pyrophosphorylase/glucosamine-1-phosphate N-acetyltransferase